MTNLSPCSLKFRIAWKKSWEKKKKKTHTNLIYKILAGISSNLKIYNLEPQHNIKKKLSTFATKLG